MEREHNQQSTRPKGNWKEGPLLFRPWVQLKKNPWAHTMRWDMTDNLKQNQPNGIQTSVQKRKSQMRTKLIIGLKEKGKFSHIPLYLFKRKTFDLIFCRLHFHHVRNLTFIHFISFFKTTLSQNYFATMWADWFNWYFKEESDPLKCMYIWIWISEHRKWLTGREKWLQREDEHVLVTKEGGRLKDKFASWLSETPKFNQTN